MSPEAQRIAIAEACGWKWYRRPCDTGKRPPLRALYHPDIHPHVIDTLAPAEDGDRNCGSTFLWYDGNIPDYLNDLNAMHEAERVLAPHAPHSAPWVVYRLELLKLAGAMQIYATAAQRAEGFLRTLDLWPNPASLPPAHALSTPASASPPVGA